MTVCWWWCSSASCMGRLFAGGWCSSTSHILRRSTGHWCGAVCLWPCLAELLLVEKAGYLKAVENQLMFIFCF
jgi:hypothetical protein